MKVNGKKIFAAALFGVLCCPNMFCYEEARHDYATVRSACASSTLVETLNGQTTLYSALNILDDDPETAWCESEDVDSGIGQSIYLTFNEKIEFDEIQIINGYEKKDYYLKNNRVKTLEIYTDYLNFERAELEDNDQNWQSHKLESKATGNIVVFSVTDVYPGRKYDDTCISGIRLLYRGKEIALKNVDKLKRVEQEIFQSNDNGLWNILQTHSKKKTASMFGLNEGNVFLMGEDKYHGYCISYVNGYFDGFYKCYFYTADEYKRNKEERFWTWKQCPGVNINDYDRLAEVVYCYYPNKLDYEQRGQSIVSSKLYRSYSQGWSGFNYECTDFIQYKNGCIYINGDRHEILDSSKVWCLDNGEF